jgi:hypothetical protein
MDLGATYDVVDAAGRPVGLFRKDFARFAALDMACRATQPRDHDGSGAQRGRGDPAPAQRHAVVLADHFDFTNDGRPMFSVVKRWTT